MTARKSTGARKVTPAALDGLMTQAEVEALLEPVEAPPAEGFTRIYHPGLDATVDVADPSVDTYLALGWTMHDPDTASPAASPTSQED